MMSRSGASAASVRVSVARARLAIEAGASHARAGEEMGDGFQAMKFTLNLLDTVRGRLTSGFLSRRSQQGQCIGDD